MRPTLLTLAVLATGLCTATPPAQVSRNVQMLSNWNPGVRCSDIWGYVDPATTREYALLCSLDGVHVLDCSEPGVPQLRGLIRTENPGSSQNRWRDIKTFGNYAYAVSEAKIVDVSTRGVPAWLHRAVLRGLTARGTVAVGVGRART